MLNQPLIAIPHSFKTRSRHDLVEALRAISNDSHVCDVAGVSQRDIAEHVGISESTWKRVRGVGGEWTKVDIYYLMKFISLYSTGTGVAIVPPKSVPVFSKSDFTYQQSMPGFANNSMCSSVSIKD